ncbi:L-asparaginase 2 [Arsenophonus nasoniae]|uniref:L-asparaginase 2 n=1 Tax=Arsenophonus nasoniae TaxID=638 RepID=UPI003879FEF3
MKTKMKISFLVLAFGVSCSCSAFALPNITVLATGGTIAGSGESPVKASYTPGTIKIDQLVSLVPQIKQIANVKGEQVVTVRSQDMATTVWLKLAQKINAQCSGTDGFVITHGTDTIEETAYFLNLTVKCEKPVVLVGAMRPVTALSSDAPANLYDAIVTAASPDSAGRDVMLVMNGKELDARNVTKLNTENLGAFQSINYGALGSVSDSKVTYTRTPVQKHTKQTPFDVSKLTQLPEVGIVYNYANASDIPAKAFIDNGYQGIVSAGVGNGNISHALLNTLSDAAQKGLVVVRSSRVSSGPTTRNGEIDDDKHGFIASGTLSPYKSRVLLMLALTQTKDPKKIQQYFTQY